MLHKIKRTSTILSIIALFANILLLTACTRTIGTKPCEVPAQNLPPIRGIRLGMSLQELGIAFPELLPEKNLIFGGSSIGKYDSWNQNDDGTDEISFSGNSFLKQLAGVSSITVKLFEKKVFDFSINYDFNSVPKDHDLFIKQVSQSINIPDALWKFKEEQYAVLDSTLR